MPLDPAVEITPDPSSNCRRGAGAASTLVDKAGEVVLELVDGHSWRAIQQSVAVVRPRGADTTRDCLRHLVIEKTAHVTEGTGVIVTRTHYV